MRTDDFNAVMNAKRVPFVPWLIHTGLHWHDSFVAGGQVGMVREMNEFTAGWDQKSKLMQFCAWRWFINGMPRLTLGHRHAASLMATRVPRECVAEIMPPWRSFLCDVPDGLIGFDGEWISHALVDMGVDPARADGKDGAPITIWGAVRSAERSPVRMYLPADQLSELASVEALGAECDAAYELLGRFVLGAAIEASQHRPAIAHGKSQTGPGTRHGLPVTTTFTLTRDVKIDCREHVRDYCLGRSGSSPSVQTLVRGHWKNQPHGISRTERKLIFVEPYWRGPEDAPIALRSHVLGQPEAQ